MVPTSGESVRDHIFLARDVDSLEAVLQGLHLEVEQAGVLDVLQTVLVTKDAKKGLVVETDDEVGQTEDEKFEFVEASNS